MEDYDQIWQLWHALKLPLDESDSRPGMEKKLERDPDLLLVAEENEVILGVIIGTWDGRYGRIYNQAVEPRVRRMGIGRALIREVERRLWEKGAREIRLLVSRDDLRAQEFYKANDYQPDERRILMIKRLSGF